MNRFAVIVTVVVLVGILLVFATPAAAGVSVDFTYSLGSATRLSNGNASYAAVFTASATTDNASSPVAYLWSFGDGYWGQGITVAHGYVLPSMNASGSFQVNLTVAWRVLVNGTPYGNSWAVTASKTIAINPPPSSGGWCGLVLVVPFAALCLVTWSCRVRSRRLR